MKRQKTVALRNVIFPIWLLWLFPPVWLVVLPANFIIDSVVLLAALKIHKIGGMKEIYKKSILKIWIFGFLADLVGTVWMFSVSLLNELLDNNTRFGSWWYENLTNAVSYHPFQNVYAVAWVAVGTAISGALIYWLNLRFSFRKLTLDDAVKRKLALALALFTAPYLFFLPTAWFY